MAPNWCRVLPSWLEDWIPRVGQKRRISWETDVEPELQKSMLSDANRHRQRQSSATSEASDWGQRQCSTMSTYSFSRQTSHAPSSSTRLLSSFVAGCVSFMLVTIMSVNFGILVFQPVSGAIPSAVQMSIVGVGIICNGTLCLLAKLPCVVVTADNGVVAPVVANMVLLLAKEIHDPDALKATAVASVALGCACFGCTQLLLVRMRLAQLVKFMPYSIPMGFLSGIGLELLSGITLAGNLCSQAAAALLAVSLCLGSWWRGWPLSVLFPVLLVSFISIFYLAGAPSDWFLEFEGSSDESTAWLWSKNDFANVQWDVLLRLGPKWFGVLFLLGSFQNILFAEVYARAPGLENRIDPDQVLTEFGASFFVGGVFGFASGFHNMACFSLSRELKSYPRAPSGFVALLSIGLWWVGIEPILRVPRFVFAGLLMWVGFKFLRTYLVQPACMLPKSETAVIIAVAGIMKVNGFAVGVLAGLVLALVGMVGELAMLSSVQVVSSVHESRSNAMRSVRAEQLLLTLGHAVLVLRMAPGFVFFATSAQLLKIVENRLGEKVEPWQTHDAWVAGSDTSDSDDEQHEGELREAALSKVVIDFALCRGFDGSLVGVLQQLVALGLRYKFQLCLAGLQPSHQLWIKSNVASHSPVRFFVDMDRALEHVEDELLESQGLTLEKEARRQSLLSVKVPQRLHSDEMAGRALQASNALTVGSLDEKVDSKGWTLLFLYSDISAISRSARPAVAQAMSLLARRCELFEASEDACPELAKQIGPGPVLILFRDGDPSLRIGGERMNTGSHAGASGVAMLPVAQAISQEIEQHIFAVEVDFRRTPSARKGVNDISFGLSPKKGAETRADSPLGSFSTTSSPPTPSRASLGSGDAESGSDIVLVAETGKLQAAETSEPRVRRRGSAKSSKAITRRNSVGADRDLLDASQIWPQFLQLAGVKDSILARLSEIPDVLTGPRVLKKGQILFHKGSAHVAIYFVANGLLSLWNEGRGHDQSQHSGGNLRGRSASLVAMQEHSKLSQGTSRLLRVGPGWTFGGNLYSFGVRDQLHALTCIAESDARILEISHQKLDRLSKDEPGLALALQGIVMHFNSRLLEHTAALLSDMHTLVFAAEPIPLQPLFRAPSMK